MVGIRRKPRPYLEWPDFCREAPSLALRACMMDLHWFANNGRLKQALADIARLVFYVGRWLASPRVQGSSNAGSRWMVVIDTPGVGGVQTLMPLLARKPPDEKITIIVTDFIHRDEATRSSIAAIPGVRLLNIDRLRGSFRTDRQLLGGLLRLLRSYPRLAPTLPLFAWRHHAYTAVARGCLTGSGWKAVIFFNERMLPSACFSAAARQLGIPTVAVQHGNFVANYLPIVVDRYLTWGRFHSAWIRQRSSCQVDEIGSPRTDSMATRRPPSAGVAASDARFTFIFFSQVGSASVSPEMVSATRRQVMALLEDSSLRIVIRLHPLDTRESWWAEGPAAKSLEYIDGAVDLEEVFDSAQMVCSFYSSVLVEALLWDVPVVQLNPYPDKVAFFPDRDGICWVTNADGLRSLLADWRNVPAAREQILSRQRALREGYFAHLGHASEAFWQALDRPISTELESSTS